MDKVDYEKSVELKGDPAKALEMAQGVFVQQGFRITETAEDGFEVSGPGMTNNKQNPLLGASKVRATVIGRALSLQAELGGVRQMRKFLLCFIPGMAIFFLILFSILPHTDRGGQPISLGSVYKLIGLIFSPWLVIIPVMTSGMRNRTVEALDTVLHNAAVISGTGKANPVG